MFGGSKDKATKKREKAQKKAAKEAQLKAELAKMDQKKHHKKRKRNKAVESTASLKDSIELSHEEALKEQGKKPTPDNSTNNDKPTVPGVVMLSKQSTQTKASLLKKQAVEREANNIIQEQRYREIVARLSEQDIFKISKMLNQAEDIFKFYQAFMKDYQNDEILLALNILDKSDVELFRYIIQNDIIDELYQGEIQLYNQTYLKEEREKFFDFKQKYPEFNSSLNVLEDYLPHIYLLGNQLNYEEVQMMSLPTQISLLKTKNDVDKFAQDNTFKTVLIFKQPYQQAIESYVKVHNAQDFPVYSTFNLKIIPKGQQITPFNRSNLIKKIALK